MSLTTKNPKIGVFFCCTAAVVFYTFTLCVLYIILYSPFQHLFFFLWNFFLNKQKKTMYWEWCGRLFMGGQILRTKKRETQASWKEGLTPLLDEDESQ